MTAEALRRRRVRAAAGGALAAGLALALAACAGPGEAPLDLFEAETAAEESAPLGGEALAQRKREMQRAQRDLVHFHATLESLRHRRDRSGSIQMAGFVDAYMGRYLEPMLAGEWQSRHPELMGIDVNLRLAKAQVLAALHDPRRVQQTIDDVARRYAGRESMLVEYPLGGETTLAEALAAVRQRKWRD